MTIRKAVPFVQHQPIRGMPIKPFGEASGEKPQKTEWVRAEDVPIINLLREIRDELKKLNAK